MKKFINIVLMLTLIFAFTPVTFAANDITLSSGSQFSVNSMTFTTTATLDQIVVNATDFTVRVSSTGNIILTSADNYTFTVTPENAYSTFSCSSGNSTLTITGNGAATITYTVTPLTTTCNTSSGSPAAPGGGGTTPPDTTPTEVVGTVSVDTLSSGGGTASLQSPVSQTVTSSGGGSASLSDGSVSFLMPVGSVSNNADLTITPQINYPQPSKGYSAVGSQIYDISVQETGAGNVINLEAAATLTFTYSNSDITNFNENTLVISYWNETTGEWVDLDTTVDQNNNTLIATVDHLTKFIIQGESTTVPLGSLIKTNDTTAVYYVGHDSKRYVFPDERVFYSWYTDFSDVLTVTNEEMTSFSMGGNVTVRPGTELVQFIQYDIYGNMQIDDPNVYAVESGGVRRWIETAEIASTLYGSNWESKIVPVKNVLIGNYALGDPISEPLYPTGSVVKETSSNNVFYISDGEKRVINTNGLTSNNIQEKFYLETSSLTSYNTISALNDYQNSVSWTSGK